MGEWTVSGVSGEMAMFLTKQCEQHDLINKNSSGFMIADTALEALRQQSYEEEDSLHEKLFKERQDTNNIWEKASEQRDIILRIIDGWCALGQTGPLSFDKTCDEMNELCKRRDVAKQLKLFWNELSNKNPSIIISKVEVTKTQIVVSFDTR